MNINQTDSPQVRALKERYKASLPEKVALIREQIEQVYASSATADSIEEANQVLHKLAGSSGMYGYDDINVLCRAAMASLGSKNADESVDVLQQVIELLEQYY